MRLVPFVRSIGTPSRTNLLLGVPSIFDEFFNEFPFRTALREGAEAWRPAVDVLEKDGNLILQAELPGVDQKDIELKLEGNVLTLKAERKREQEEDNKNYRLVESFYGTFSRSFTLPETAELDKVTADYKNGVLTISIPQKPELKPREIPVKAA
jgi:HSP20 family protein